MGTDLNLALLSVLFFVRVITGCVLILPLSLFIYPKCVKFRQSLSLAPFVRINSKTEHPVKNECVYKDVYAWLE